MFTAKFTYLLRFDELGAKIRYCSRLFNQTGVISHAKEPKLQTVGTPDSSN